MTRKRNRRREGVETRDIERGGRVALVSCLALFLGAGVTKGESNPSTSPQSPSATKQTVSPREKRRPCVILLVLVVPDRR